MSVRYKYCIVPKCNNTTVKAPDKLFINVPRNPVVRKKWCKAMRRDPKLNPELSARSARHVCSDHFDLETDMENYIRHKLQRVPIRMKKGVVPHIFTCQKSLPAAPVRHTGRKRKRLRRAKSPGTASKEEEKKDHPIPLEPAIVIKEEPIDYDEPTPSTSTATANDEFILPHQENTWRLTAPVVEPQLTFSVASLAPTSDPETPDAELARKKRKIQMATFVPTTNGPDVRPHSPVENFGDTSNPGSTKESRKDQFDVFGEYIAAKLRSLDRKSCAYAQKAIGDIIFEAEMGKFLNEDSDGKDLRNCVS